MGKRLLVVFLAAVLAVGLTACGGSSDTATTDTAASGDVKELTFTPGKLTVATGNPAWLFTDEIIVK